MKQCKECKEKKPLTEFFECGTYKNKVYYRGECVECTKARQRNNLLAKERYNEFRRTKEYKEKRKEYRSRIEINERERELARKNYPNHRAKKSARHIERYRKDPIYRLTVLLRQRTKELIRANYWTPKNKFKDYIGCTLDELKSHLEKQFKDGMTWENQGRGGWHIDHIIPLSTAKTQEELYKLCHYTNLQPLWEIDNLKKSNKIFK